MPAKRAVDLAGSLFLLLALSPVLLTAAAAVAVSSPGPVLHPAPRTGLHGRPFQMFTFRTTHAGHATAVGRLLRRRFLDGLPQLINVVRGDMSLVGPPPLPVEPAPAGPGRARLAVRPGITGLWQISGRSELPWEEMTVLDLHYVEQHWLGLDLMILARTVPTALAGRPPVRVA
ncbi:lipopolysaccharide/colanic/teichoic acid biosynthesis glycosyltransferase [Streptomyces sp. V4I23]|uniref:sugar transferase n=1 Tax=Streptomyces sp. V4I23 TaxID=3042282 RepID=UPI0027872286|nr:sugar transferase [Streptomyces sp. V4I23]MDQ1009486.1 lipopolysaccharide/colanic/teichoic acid biosynthesis glycosyltransferase [Streptomyces sp. V4I23]